MLAKVVMLEAGTDFLAVMPTAAPNDLPARRESLGLGLLGFFFFLAAMLFSFRGELGEGAQTKGCTNSPHEGGHVPVGHLLYDLKAT